MRPSPRQVIHDVVSGSSRLTLGTMRDMHYPRKHEAAPMKGDRPSAPGGLASRCLAANQIVDCDMEELVGTAVITTGLVDRSFVDPALDEPTYPVPGSAEELDAFARLQRGLAPMFGRVFPDPCARRTVVVIPSMSLDREELTKLTGASHYEERFLCLLLLLRLPATRVIYVTSEPIAPAIVDYYLRLVRGVDSSEARSRLTMLSCRDASPIPLTDKILDRPALLSRIRALVDDPASAHLTCFTTTPRERTLAVRLGIPLYGCDPALAYLGTKSGSRVVFRRAGVPTPPGFEHLRGDADMIRALVELKREHPWVRRAVIKLEEGFSGEGNAIFSYQGAPTGHALGRWVGSVLPTNVHCVAADEQWESYSSQFARLGGIVEAFVEGGEMRSPSAQCRIDPLGTTQLISTHDQVLGGRSGQIYLGCSFPAEESCSPGLHDAARRVAAVLAGDGVVGRFGIDFVSTRAHDSAPDDWRHYAIEINLRKGGTTHPFLTLQLLTDGSYDPATGLYHAGDGHPCFYVSSDNLCNPAYTAFTPDDVISTASRVDLQYDSATGRGVVFHLMGALQDFGKLGAVCIAPTREGARALFAQTVTFLDAQAGTPIRRHVVATHRPPGAPVPETLRDGVTVTRPSD